jgi:hypothetical protein
MVLTSSLSLFFLLVDLVVGFFFMVEMKKGPNPLWIRGPWLAAID